MSKCHHLTDADSGVALVSAVQEQHDDCVKSLIQAGADVNKERHVTALNSAVLNGCDQYVSMLLEEGANVNACDINARTPLICAAEKGFHAYIPVLMKAGADVKTTPILQYAATFGHEECIRSLLQVGADVNQEDDVGLTPLINAIEGLHYNCMKILIEAGADLNYRDFDKIPVLISLGYAVGHRPSRSSYTNAVRCTQLMLKSGVQINRRDMFRKNSLETALIELYKSKSTKTCAKVAPMLLFAAGVKLNRKLKRNEGVPSPFIKRREFLHFLPLSGCNFCLKHLCRKAIRKHLLQVDKHTNLFTRVTQLGLPGHLPEYLVYDMSLEKEYKFDDDTGNDNNDDDCDDNDDDDNNHNDDDEEEDNDDDNNHNDDDEEEDDDDDNEEEGEDVDDDDDDEEEDDEVSDGTADTFDSFSDFNIEDDSDDDDEDDEDEDDN